MRSTVKGPIAIGLVVLFVLLARTSAERDVVVGDEDRVTLWLPLADQSGR